MRFFFDIINIFVFIYFFFVRNISVSTQSYLKEFITSGKIASHHNNVQSSPSLKLLSRFQRLLIGKLLTKDPNCRDASETLLLKYLNCFTSHVVATLNVAYDVSLISSKNFLFVLQILKDDIIGKFYLLIIIIVFRADFFNS